MACFGLFGFSSVSSVPGRRRGASFAGLPFAHKTWVTLVCLLLDTPYGRCQAAHKIAYCFFLFL